MKTTPWRITFDTNPDDCNLKCVMCEEHSPYSDRQKNRIACGKPPRRMDIRVLERVLDELKHQPPREIIPSTMGEPLLYGDFDRIIELCQQYGIRLNLTTNGTFPRRGVSEWARLLLPVCSDVKISFNGVTAETQEEIMRQTRMAIVNENIHRFVQIRDEIAAAGGNYCSVTLQLTFLEQNLAEIPEVIRFAAQINVDRVKGHHLWVHFPEMAAQDLRRSSESVARWNQTVSLCRSVAERTRRPTGEAVRLENFVPLEYNAKQEVPASFVCPFLGKEAWVNHEGRFDPCCAPDELRQGLGNFGFVPDSGFLSIWEGSSYRDLVKQYRNHKLCQGCVMRRAEERNRA